MLSGILRENWHHAVYGTGLGLTAVLFYFFWWVALLICEVMLLIAIIENLGSFFSFGLWDQASQASVPSDRTDVQMITGAIRSVRTPCSRARENAIAPAGPPAFKRKGACQGFAGDSA